MKNVEFDTEMQKETIKEVIENIIR